MGLLTTPAFFWAVGAMFWSLPLATLTFYVFPLQLRGKRNDVFGWCAFSAALMQLIRDSFVSAGLTVWCPGPAALGWGVGINCPSSRYNCRTAFLVDLLGVKVRKSGNNELYRSGRCLYLVRMCLCPDGRACAHALVPWSCQSCDSCFLPCTHCSSPAPCMEILLVAAPDFGRG
jgi:hypothetical protein